MFKDIMNNDLNVFINLEEFGEEVTINGTPIIVVEDEEGMKEYKKQNLELFYEDMILFYCLEIDFDRINIDNHIEYNGLFYNVISKNKQDGLYQVVLKRSTQGTMKEWF